MSSSRSNALDAQSVAELDTLNQAGDILAMGDHVEDAHWRAESAMLVPRAAPRLIVCGMGGSAIGADLAVALAGSRLRAPLHVQRGYDLPPWAAAGDAVLLSSYSGDTEETLSCYDQAERLGATIYCVSSGGALSDRAHAAGHPLVGLPGVLQPRAAVAYGVIATLEIAIVCGIVDAAIRQELAATAAPLRERAAEWAPAAPDGAPPKVLAREAYGRVPVIYGAGLTAPVAYRWRTQINENAKTPAWSAELSECNHNEICAWEGAEDVVGQNAWFLRDVDQGERMHKRIDLNADVARGHGAPTEIIDTIGESRAERLLAAVMLGDLVSLYLGVLRGHDPSPVPLIEVLKGRLGRPGA